MAEASRKPFLLLSNLCYYIVPHLLYSYFEQITRLRSLKTMLASWGSESTSQPKNAPSLN